MPAIPLFARTFHANATQVGLIISSFALARFGSGLISGKFVDAIGERLTLGFGLGMVSISSLLCGFAHSYWQLLTYRAAGGLGSSMFSVSASALLMRSVNDLSITRDSSLAALLVQHLVESSPLSHYAHHSLSMQSRSWRLHLPHFSTCTRSASVDPLSINRVKMIEYFFGMQSSFILIA